MSDDSREDDTKDGNHKQRCRWVSASTKPLHAASRASCPTASSSAIPIRNHRNEVSSKTERWTWISDGALRIWAEGVKAGIALRRATWAQGSTHHNTEASRWHSGFSGETERV